MILKAPRLQNYFSPGDLFALALALEVGRIRGFFPALPKQKHSVEKRISAPKKNRGTPKWMVYNGKPY